MITGSHAKTYLAMMEVVHTTKWSFFSPLFHGSLWSLIELRDPFLVMDGEQGRGLAWLPGSPEPTILDGNITRWRTI